jgi:hypothetical protein
MDCFFPFIYDSKTNKKEKFEPLPLYIDDYIPELEIIKDEEIKNKIIIIQM